MNMMYISKVRKEEVPHKRERYDFSDIEKELETLSPKEALKVYIPDERKLMACRMYFIRKGYKVVKVKNTLYISKK